MEKETASSLHAALAAQREFTIHSDKLIPLSKDNAMQMLLGSFKTAGRKTMDSSPKKFQNSLEMLLLNILAAAIII